MRKTVLGIVALALITGSCDLRAEITVNSNGSGTFATVFAVGRSMREAFEQSSLGLEDPFAELRADLADDPVTWTVTDYREGDLEGLRATFAFSSPQDMRDKLLALSEEPEGDDALREFTLARLGEGWEFHGIASNLGAQRSSPDPSVTLPEPASLVRVQFLVTLPGKAQQTNADEVHPAGPSTTFVWTPNLEDDGITFVARTTAAAGSGAPLMLFAAVVGVAMAGVFLVLRRREMPVPILFEDDRTDRVLETPVGAVSGTDADTKRSG